MVVVRQLGGDTERGCTIVNHSSIPSPTIAFARLLRLVHALYQWCQCLPPESQHRCAFGRVMLFFLKFSKNVKLRPSDVSIDNLVFKLHYRATFWFLLACTLLVSSKQFIKQHIECISNDSVKQVINTFCFFSSTYTISHLHNTSYQRGVHILAPGVGPDHPNDDRKYHAYYQWVPFFFGAQAVLFYIPHHIWKKHERGRIQAIVDHVNTLPYSGDSDKEIKGYKISSHETRKKKEKLMKDIYLSWSRMKINRDWALSYIVCEVLNLVNIIFQIVMVNIFIKGQFLSLGIRWMEDSEEVLDRVFPKVTKCIFHTYGKSGQIQNHDTLCVMSLNIINEKLFTIMWFWFVILFVLTVGAIVWRLFCFIFHKDYIFNRLVWGEVITGQTLRPAEIDMISNIPFTDWLFLVYIGKNMNSGLFRNAVADLYQTVHSRMIDEIHGSKGVSETLC